MTNYTDSKLLLIDFFFILPMNAIFTILKGGDNMALDYIIIGERLKKARLAKGFTQENLAEKLDLSVAFLSRVERGNAHINLSRLSELCSILEISEGEILNGTSSNASDYMKSDFNTLLKKCSPEKQKLIYNIAKVIAESK